MTATITCPDWCSTPNGTPGHLHEQDDTLIPRANGRPVSVALSHDDRNGQTILHVGDMQFTPDQALQLAVAVLNNADLGWQCNPADGLKQDTLEYAINWGALADLVRLAGGH